MKKSFLFGLLLLVLSITGYGEVSKNVKISETKIITADPLPSWNNTEVKQNIITYMKKITDEKSPDYIPPEERTATFDNDGTLWAEQPVVEELFIVYYAERMVKENPDLKNKSPYNKINEFYSNGKFTVKDRQTFDELVGITHSGMAN